MNLFKPVNEWMVRLLFSAAMIAEHFKIYVLGPVLSAGGKAESSPDALALDMREREMSYKRIEFKFMIQSPDDFEENGQFDMAVAWASMVPRPILERALLEKHGCREIILLGEHKLCRDLADYNDENIRSVSVTTKLEGMLMRRSMEGILTAFYAVSVAPREFSIAEVLDFLRKNLENNGFDLSRKSIAQKSVASLQFGGVLEKNRRFWYRWSPALSPAHALPVITKLILKSRDTLPTI
ncbi:MAG TPA: hypothetical protein VJB59_09885 [Bdellovibrionota bacterium]|nr:hypothetical protein [Bdellovibrionota bacterium]